MTQNEPTRNKELTGFISLLVLLLSVTILSFVVGPNSDVSGVRLAARPTSTPTAIPPTRTPIPTLTPRPSDTPTPAPTNTPLPPTEAPTSSDSSAGTGDYDPALVSAGETLFLASCSACHGADARGIPNLGKDLVASDFIHGLSDDELVTFIITGRPIWDPLNTTGIDMPGRGGNPALSNDDIAAIVAYIRVLSDTGGGGSAPANGADDQSSSAAGDYDPALVSAGETLFLASCSACHGADARGIPNLGKDLVASDFIDGLSDDELVTFIITGRPIWDPLNTTGIDMPGRGGNPALSNDDIAAIVAYIRSLAP